SFWLQDSCGIQGFLVLSFFVCIKEVLRTITSRIDKTIRFLENVVFYKELAKDGNFGAIYELAECYVHGNDASKMRRRKLWCNIQTSRML
ncbi:5377_t:CDS:2, partial [Dentiscutata heterogama]